MIKEQLSKVLIKLPESNLIKLSLFMKNKYRGGLAHAAVLPTTNESIVRVYLHVLFATKLIHVMLS